MLARIVKHSQIVGYLQNDGDSWRLPCDRSYELSHRGEAARRHTSASVLHGTACNSRALPTAEFGGSLHRQVDPSSVPRASLSDPAEGRASPYEGDGLRLQ